MAYIYKRGSKWAYRAYAGKDPVTGKDKQVGKSGFRTKKDAQLAAALIERQLHEKEYIESSDITFEALSKQWLEHYFSQGAKESSIRSRKIALKRIIKEIGFFRIQQITKKKYQDTIDKLAREHSTNYVSNIHTTANMIFKYAKEMKLIKDIPTNEIKLPKKKKTVSELEKDNEIRENFLEKDELEKFLMVAKENGLEGDLLAFTMLAYTGLRIGEMIALKWADIDFENLTLRVYKTYYSPNNKQKEFKLLTPKTESSIRTITIDPILVNMLSAYKLKQEKIKEINKPFYHDKGFIFATNEGYPKPPKHFTVRLKRLLKKAGISKHITLHSFRHTHTSLLIEANVHIKEIQERLGHSDIRTTMDIYAHMTKSVKKEASEKFSRLMENLSKNLFG